MTDITSPSKLSAPSVEIVRSWRRPARGPGRTSSRRRVGAAAALGPGFVAAIAYVDPGNFATNFAGGAQFGYGLLWVVVGANLVAMVIQFLSAKLGVVTGRNLPELCREVLPRKLSWGMWAQAEVVAMATDLAEFTGAAIGLNLLFGMPLLPAGLLTAVISFAILALQSRGHRPFELVIGFLLALICGGFLYLSIVVPPSPGDAAAGLVPHFADSDALLLAIGIIGATVMPHAIYLHSGLTCRRLRTIDLREKKRLLNLGRLDIGIAMGFAGLVNISMLAIAAELFHSPGATAISLDEAHARLATMVGGGAALAFAAALLASGISSASVGSAAGQMVMEGFLGARLPLWLRRSVTMLPALALLAIGVEPTRVLVLSQVVLSFGIPFALVALLWLTSRRSLMGDHVNRPATIVGVGLVVVVLSGLNLLLIGQAVLQ